MDLHLTNRKNFIPVSSSYGNWNFRDVQLPVSTFVKAERVRLKPKDTVFDLIGKH